MMTINCKGTLIDFSTPRVMGILNITPDSFFDGGRYKNESTILRQVEKMLLEGATFIDVGAYSSRPGAAHISEAEELSRIVPVMELLVREFPNIIISVDTFRSAVAEQTIDAGFLDKIVPENLLLPTAIKVAAPASMVLMLVVVI